MKIITPFNHNVPKGIISNLKWRRNVIQLASEDREFADTMKEACNIDPLFFFNGFVWTYDPRCTVVNSSNVPFILYPFQEDAIVKILNAIGEHDILIEKSRDMGASWMCVGAITWCYLFDKRLSFLFGSRVEDYVDLPGNPKALMTKMDYILDNLPIWLRPEGYSDKEHRKFLHIENPENGSVIDGESTTEDFARGDRRTAILLDEFAAVKNGKSVAAATRDATKCRIFNSTPDGTANEFYNIRQTDIVKIRLHWSEHPIKSAGLYTTDERGFLKVLDKEGYPEDYQPILDGKLRSPWYDNECKRASSMREIASEIDIDYQGSGGQYFNPNKIQAAITKFSCSPLFIGNLDYDALTGEFTEFREDSNGKLKLWCKIGANGKPLINPEHQLVCGNDISAGTGASNSVCVIGNKVTGEKFAEYVNPYLRPEQFATQVYAILKWFGNPKAIWESGGPGRQFGDKLIELGCSHYYLRTREESLSKKVTDIPGVAQNDGIKTQIMSSYRNAIEEFRYINTSKEALEDTLDYIYGPNGCPVHAKAQSKDDPSGAKSNHGDRAMADALMWKLMSENQSKPKQEEQKIPIGCLAWRNNMRKKLLNKNSNDGW